MKPRGIMKRGAIYQGCGPVQRKAIVVVGMARLVRCLHQIKKIWPTERTETARSSSVFVDVMDSDMDGLSNERVDFSSLPVDRGLGRRSRLRRILNGLNVRGLVTNRQRELCVGCVELRRMTCSQMRRCLRGRLRTSHPRNAGLSLSDTFCRG